MNINEETATKIMGWEKTQQKVVDGFGEDYGFIPYWQIIDDDGNMISQFEVREWRPDQDRNQSRIVVEKAVEILSRYTDNTYDILGDCMDQFTEHDSSWGWIFATPEQECRAALMAVEEAQK